MTTIAINATAWESLTEGQRVGLVETTGIPRLGEPAIFVDENDVEWRIHDDSRISEDQVAAVATLMENPELIPEVTIDEEADPDAL